MFEAAAVERAVGMEVYATVGARCSGRAKSSPDDFAVEERARLGEISKVPAEGYRPLYRVEKRGIDTLHMAKEMSNELRGRVSYAGLKDSKAVAVQYVTPTSTRTAAPERVNRERFSAELVGWVPKPLTRGSSAGNSFRVVLRDCCDEVGERAEEAFMAARGRRLPNYFGLQRFGVGGSGTHLVGKALVKKKFEEAVELILGSRAGEARSYRGDVEAAVARETSRHPGEWVRALRAVPLRLRRLYVQAYQSYIFNASLSRALRGGEDISAYREGDNWAEVSEGGLVASYAKSAKLAPEGDAAPMIQIPGYAYRNYGTRFDRYVEGVLGEEGVSAGEFFILELPEASAEGGFRRAHLGVADPSCEVSGGTARLAFSLGRGQYATVLLREVLKPEDPVACGLV